MNSENEVIFEFATEKNCCYVGVIQIIIEWENDQDERFCELTYLNSKRYPYSKTFPDGYHWMQFSKPTGMKVTDISIPSCENVINLYGCSAADNLFKLKPLFPNQTLNIKNCIIEIEILERSS